MPIFIVLLLALAALMLLGGSLSGRCGDQPPAPTQEIFDVAGAIALAEDSDPDWNNPGSLTSSFGFPTLGPANSAGVLKFQNCRDGWMALYQQLGAIVSGSSRYSLSDTIATFGMSYSGGDPNWAKNVARELQKTPDTTLGEILT